MNHPRHPTRKPPAPAAPASRDGIESWLDVLTAMLNLPPSQRAQVRDELEDHLRSRVDDLLIAGKSEPEAVRMAIAELGETAQLARQITSANRTHKSFRRFAMNATFFVLAGSILTAGVSMMMPNNSTITRETMAVEQLEHTSSEASITPEVRTVFIEKSVLYGTLEQLAAIFDREFVVSNNAKRTMMDGRKFSPTNASLEGEFTLEQAITRVRQIYVGDLIDLAISTNDESIKLLTHSEYERSRVVINAYPIPVWAESDSQQALYAQSIEQILSTKHELDYTTIQPINGSLVVAAPPEIHAEIIDMAAQLKVLAEEMREKNEARRERQHAVKERQLKALEREYEMAKTVYIETQRQLGKLQAERSQLDSQRVREIQEIGRPTLKDHDKVNAEYVPKMDVLDQRISEFHFEVEEAKGRFERLQSILIDAEAEFIISNLNEPVGDAAGAGPSGSRIVYIQGPGDVRSGTYQLPEAGKLTLSRFLISSNAQDAEGNVTLERDGNTRLIGTTTAVLSGEIEPITLLPDDRIMISAAD